MESDQTTYTENQCVQQQMSKKNLKTILARQNIKISRNGNGG